MHNPPPKCMEWNVIKQRYAAGDLIDPGWLEHRKLSGALSASKEFGKFGISMGVLSRWAICSEVRWEGMLQS